MSYIRMIRGRYPWLVAACGALQLRVMLDRKSFSIKCDSASSGPPKSTAPLNNNAILDKDKEKSEQLASMAAKLPVSSSAILANEDATISIKEYIQSPERKQQREESLDRYVSEILKNPDLNVKEIPDAIEKHIYRYTIKMTIDAILYWICSLDGKIMLKHRLVLGVQSASGLVLNPPSVPLDKEPLNDFVATLLKEKMINVSWLPDSLEHKLYFNCLLLIFTVVQSFLGATTIDLVGHSIQIGLHPNKTYFRSLANKAAKKRSGVSELLLDKLVDDLLKSDRNLAYIPDFAERQIFKTLYSLVLCIIDEMTSDLKLNVIGDQIVFKLEPHIVSTPSLLESMAHHEHSTHISASMNTPSSISSTAAGALPSSVRVDNNVPSLRAEEGRLSEALQLVRARRKELEAIERANEGGGRGLSSSIPGMTGIGDALAELDELLERTGINTQELMAKYTASTYSHIGQLAIGFTAGAFSAYLINMILNRKS